MRKSGGGGPSLFVFYCIFWPNFQVFCRVLVMLPSPACLKV
jgi:hypothetical protein